MRSAVATLRAFARAGRSFRGASALRPQIERKKWGRRTGGLKLHGNCSNKQKRQTKKVPSDPSNNSFTNRHARPELGMLENRCLLPLLPAPTFGRHGSILGKRPANSQLEACISAQPFTPPQRLSSFENRLGGIAAPGLYLRSRPGPYPQARSARNSPPLPL